MGIGLVDPILKPIADNLNASPSQVSLLFISYMAVMGVAMLITGVVSSRIGPKYTLLLGLLVIIAGALATIVNSARGSVAQAIILYEAALGLGIAVGPLVGGVLGEQFNHHLPFWVGAGAVVLFATRTHPTGIDAEEGEIEELTDQATAVTIRSDS